MASASGLDIVSESIESSTNPEKDKLRRAAFDVLKEIWKDPVSQHETKPRHHIKAGASIKHDPNDDARLEFDSFIMPDETFLGEGRKPKRRRTNTNSPTTGIKP